MTDARRLALRAGSAALALLTLVAARVYVESHRALAAADVASAQGDVAETMVHLRRAARWHAPLNPACSEALAQLRRIAEHAEAEQDTPTALYAWRAIRGANVAAESLFTPHADESALAEERVAALMARVDPPQIDAGDSVAEREARYLSALREHGRPNRLALVAAWMGLGVFVLGLFGVATRGFDAEDRKLRDALVRYGFASAVGFGVLVAGLAFA